MGSDAPTKMAEATITLSKSNASDDEYEWIDPIAFGRNKITNIGGKSKSNNHRTSKITSPSQPRNTEDINNYGGNGEDDSNNDESHSSFFSSSVGDNISKSFDWALETTMMQNCRNPFEFYCLPINFPKARGQSVSTRQQWVQSEEDDIDEEVLRRPVTDSEDDNDEAGNEEHRPFVPFHLPLSCEYCGSHSIRKCREFDPNCRRPKTFFPKTKPPFGWSSA